MISKLLDRGVGALSLATLVCVGVVEWTGFSGARLLADCTAALLTLVLALETPMSRRVFALIGLALAVAAFIAAPGDPAWAWALVERALRTAAFIAAFFAALATLRNASASAVAIQKAGRFLAQQPPGRRYLALTAGGQLFGMLLNYGAIVLLGGMAAASAREDPDPEIRAHRTRRMLLAVQRGFVSTLPWSPIAFAVAITTALTPGARWADAAGPCIVSGLILAGVGYALDTAFKPKLSRPAPARRAPEGGWALLLPLVGLLILLFVSALTLHVLSDVRIVGVVMALVPAISAVWIALQNPETPWSTLGSRARDYFETELPSYRGEMLLLMMAGFIGTLGAGLLGPVLERSAIDLSAVPAWLLLGSFVWVIPILGQAGMNPILSVSLLAPLLPASAAMGVAPSDVIVALTAGWALSGANSPYTATTLLIGSLGGVSAQHVGLVWNGLYSLVAGLALTVWVVLVVAW